MGNPKRTQSSTTLFFGYHHNFTLWFGGDVLDPVSVKSFCWSGEPQWNPHIQAVWESFSKSTPDSQAPCYCKPQQKMQQHCRSKGVGVCIVLVANLNWLCEINWNYIFPLKSIGGFGKYLWETKSWHHKKIIQLLPRNNSPAFEFISIGGRDFLRRPFPYSISTAPDLKDTNLERAAILPTPA